MIPATLTIIINGIGKGFTVLLRTTEEHSSVEEHPHGLIASLAMATAILGELHDNTRPELIRLYIKRVHRKITEIAEWLERFF